VPSVPSASAIPGSLFGASLPPLHGIDSGLDSPFAKPSAPKPAGGYTQINKSITPAPPPAVMQPAKAVATKRPMAQLPTALVIVIAVVVILAITLILYFALRPPARPAVTPAANSAASAAASPQTTPVTSPVAAPSATPSSTPSSTPSATPPKNP
jgi:hypothetical protein